MHRFRPLLMCVLAACALWCPLPSQAHDVDGPDDCPRPTTDRGDAPEGIDAYLGVLGRFPTCVSPGPPGSHDYNCQTISNPPGPTGFVLHETSATSATHYWLGCLSAGPPLGIDSEPDGKVSLGGVPFSACAPGLAVDCFEPAFGMTFGQDECYGDNDAGLGAPPLLNTCGLSSVSFTAHSCGAASVQVYLNVLVDMNHDGDWNDNIYCNLPGGCAYEWAVKNQLVVLQPGCHTLSSQSFRLGPNATEGWLRISLSDQAVNDDFPWAGSATMLGGRLQGGETEDYPVTIRPAIPEPCQGSFNDFGDAPEDLLAYPGGTIGHFPTCSSPSAPGTPDLACASTDPPPALTGFVKHVTVASDASKVGLGCGDPFAATLAIDDDPDGKVNLVGAGSTSHCSAATITDCAEVAFGGTTFGQDECFGDADSGVSPVSFSTCSPATVSFRTFNCGASVEGYLNILVDMNEDGDWTDTFMCGTQCAREWSIRNQLVPLPSGCLSQTSPSFLIGPRPGHAWMRVTLTLQPVPDDFAWNGSAGSATGVFQNGETEDYPVEIGGPPCDIGYRDFGDAPEGYSAAPTFFGNYPTCTAPTAPAGSQEIECGAPRSVAPPAGATAGFVEHIASAGAARGFWFGCGPTPTFGVDDEADGKTSPGVPTSFCNDLLVDCLANAFGIDFGQDECYGDGDAGLATAVEFRACSLSTLTYQAYSCDHPQDAYLNVLADWSQDGDWNDNVGCGPGSSCAPEWAVKNAPVALAAGCNTYVTPYFQVGPRLGPSWLRMTITADPVPEDFPWNGSLSTPNASFAGGETEDYPVTIRPMSVGVGPDVSPAGLWLASPAPNPGVHATTVRFGLPRETHVTLTVYDVIGRRVKQLFDGPLSAGLHAVEWDYRNAAGVEVPVGVYLMRLEAAGQVLTQRAVHAR